MPLLLSMSTCLYERARLMGMRARCQVRWWAGVEGSGRRVPRAGGAQIAEGSAPLPLKDGLGIA